MSLKDVSDLATALESPNCRLSNLLLWNNHLGDKGAAIIADSLPTSSIVCLEIISNNIGVEGISKLASAIKNPKCKVRYFNVRYNPLKDAGVVALSDQLKGSALNALNLRGVDFSDDGARGLADVLSMPNCRLIWLEISGNSDLTNNGASLIENAMEINHSLLCCRLFSGSLYYNTVKINNLLQRNMDIFYDTCNRLLGDRAITSDDRERIFLQSQTIISKEAQSTINISPNQYTKNLAANVIQKLQQEYDNNLIYCLDTIANLPTVLANIIRIYVKENDSKYYVSFSNSLRCNTLAYTLQALDLGHTSAPSPQLVAMQTIDTEESYSEPDEENGSDEAHFSGSYSSSEGEVYNSERASQAQLDEEQATINNQQLSAGKRYSNSDCMIAHFVQSIDSKENESSKSLLMTIFAWLKDLSEELQQKLLLSFSLQQVMKFLETTLNPDKSIENQLSFEAIQKIEAEHQLYSNFTGASQEYAQNNIEVPIPIDEYAGEQLINGILILKPTPHLDAYNF